MESTVPLHLSRLQLLSDYDATAQATKDTADPTAPPTPGANLNATEGVLAEESRMPSAGSAPIHLRTTRVFATV